MREKHKHCEIIKAWADGAEIELFGSDGEWQEISHPSFFDNGIYRIKPELKTDVVKFASSIYVEDDDEVEMGISDHKFASSNLKLTFDGETGKLKSAEVIS